MHNSSLWTGGDVPAPRLGGPGDQNPVSGQLFGIDVERQPNEPVVATVVGSIDLLTATALRMCVEDNVTDANGLVLDLTRVDFLSASGLTVLADTEQRSGRENLLWAVVANTRAVLRPLDLLGLRERLPLYDSLPRAIAVLAGVGAR